MEGCVAILAARRAREQSKEMPLTALLFVLSGRQVAAPKFLDFFVSGIFHNLGIPW